VYVVGAAFVVLAAFSVVTESVVVPSDAELELPIPLLNLGNTGYNILSAIITL